jgi:hypothetical protein
MQADKKVRGGRVRYALPARLGRMPAGAPTVEVEGARVLRALDAVARIDTGEAGG